MTNETSLTIPARISPPDGVHPLLWILTSICGLTVSFIREKAVIPQSVMRRLSTGRPVSPAHTRALARLLDWARTQLVEGVPDRRDVHPLLRDHRKTVFAIIAAAIDQYTRSPHPSEEPLTELETALLSSVGTGAPRADVMTLMRNARFSGSAIQAAARRLGLREDLGENGRVWWWPPDAPPPPVFSDPQPVTLRATTRRISRIADAIVTFLARSGGVADCRDVIYHVMDRTGCSRPAVFRAANTLKLIRETSGFGTAKRALWGLPHTRRESSPAPELCRELVEGADGFLTRCSRSIDHDGDHLPPEAPE